MGVAAFDDVFGIVNFSIAAAVAAGLLGGSAFAFPGSLVQPVGQILGGLGIGALCGLVMNLGTRVLRRETEGALVVLVFAMLALCYGTSVLAGCDELLATMSMGAVVANLNPRREEIFGLLERYTEDLIFVLFFTLSGMHLSFTGLGTSLPLIGAFIVMRAVGKFGGAYLGAHAASAPRSVRRYASFGLLPQGGIVIGLALTIRARPEFHAIAETLVGVVIGATVLHEIVGPIAARIALTRSGETGAGAVEETTSGGPTAACGGHSEASS
jgi:Kef-type K+ transport system membrane component KefB